MTKKTVACIPIETLKRESIIASIAEGINQIAKREAVETSTISEMIITMSQKYVIGFSITFTPFFCIIS